jgi:hypothetical protein
LPDIKRRTPVAALPSKAAVCRFSLANTKFINQHNQTCCELYNAALQERRDAYKLNRISLNYFDQANQLSDIKEIRDDLTEIHSQSFAGYSQTS